MEETAGWTSVGPVGDLPEGRGTRVEVDGDPVLVVRSGDRVFAVASRCTHQGAPLDRAPVRVAGSAASVTCPVHGSMFGLEDGRVLRGPARAPLAAYEARVEEGSLLLRARPPES
jgi:nitrite reductase/ring-hydroxylating ferredoxin subunit